MEDNGGWKQKREREVTKKMMEISTLILIQKGSDVDWMWYQSDKHKLKYQSKDLNFVIKELEMQYDDESKN